MPNPKRRHSKATHLQASRARRADPHRALRVSELPRAQAAPPGLREVRPRTRAAKFSRRKKRRAHTLVPSLTDIALDAMGSDHAPEPRFAVPSLHAAPILFAFI